MRLDECSTLIAAIPPKAGLGNRVRTLLSLEAIAKVNEQRFAYHWPVGPRFGAPIQRLWRYEADQLATWTAVRRCARRGDAVVVSSFQEFTGDACVDAPDWRARFRDLPPSTEVIKRVLRLQEQIGGVPYIGVMVRVGRRAHPLTLAKSPLDWYLSRLRELVAVGGFRLFVSSDSVRGSDAIRNAFPQVVVQEDKGYYNSGRALVASVVDLYMLAASSYIVGPHYSSFPELAVYLAGAGQSLETSERRPTSFAPLVPAQDALRPSYGRVLL